MLGKLWFRLAATAVTVLLPAAAAPADSVTHDTTTVQMDFVTVGNPGNDPDDEGVWVGDPLGHGRVDYTYRIGKYEVTADQWAAAIAADPNVGDRGIWSGSQPIAGVSWHEAAKFCNWLTTGRHDQGYYTIAAGLATPNSLGHDEYAAIHGKTYFLPTEEEWYKAAYYAPGKSGYWDYPTRHDEPAPLDGIDSAGDTLFDAVFRDGYDQDRPNDVDNVGPPSAYGTFGQGGNVDEWCETKFSSSTACVIRGGSWYTPLDRLHAASRWPEQPGIDYYRDLGFRVASVPEPGSGTLLACGLLFVAFYGRRRT